MLTKYEKLMLKLKGVELTQRQTIISFMAKAIDNPDINIISVEGAEVLQLALNDIETLCQK